MSENTLKTVFIFDSEIADRRISETEGRLFALNTDLNNLGKTSTFGKTVADDLGLAGKSIDTFQNKVAGLSKPTFGGEYYEQSKKISDAWESGVKGADKFQTAAEKSLTSTRGLADAGANSLREIGKFYNQSAGIVAKGIPNNTLYNEIEKSRLSVQKLNGQRLDGKNFDGLTQAGIRLHTELGRVQTDISRLNAALSKTTDKGVIKILNEDLTVAENKFASLNARARQYEKTASRAPSSARTGAGAGDDKFHRIQGYGAVFREFAPEGINESVLNAGGQLAAVAGIGTATLAVFGAIAVAGLAIVKVTQNIREEAEHQLNVQVRINGEINKQILGGIELNRQFAEQRANSERGDNFSRSVRGETFDQLTSRQKNLEDTLKRLDILRKAVAFASNPNEAKAAAESLDNNIANTQRELLDVEKRRRELPFEKSSSANDALNKNAENFGKTQADIAASEKRFAEQQKKFSKGILSLKDDFRDALASAESSDNPLLKTLVEIETATEKARVKFGAFGKDVVNKIADIEKANLGKALNLQKFQNNFAALKFDQDRARLEAAPERGFADFARKLELVNRKVEFVSGGNDLNRKIAEADFFADKFNPNNPKSFAEFNRRGANDDISAAGISIKNAVSDIRDLKNISLQGTGLAGKEAVINKILDSIPPRDELIKRIASPNLRGDSQSLLEEQAQALRVKKDIERNKFNNFLEDQKTAEFGKVFAREQIGLINSSALTDKEKAERRLAVTDSLGNDLDAGLKRQRIQDFVASAGEKRAEEKEAARDLKDLKELVAGMVKQLTEKGIKTDAPPPVVNVTLNGVEGDVSQNQLPPSATSNDTAAAYRDYSGLSFYGENEIQQTLRGHRR